jgi:hypothetical protein
VGDERQTEVRARRVEGIEGRVVEPGQAGAVGGREVDTSEASLRRPSHFGDARVEVPFGLSQSNLPGWLD